MKKRKKSRGFTLIEIMIVVAIVAILATIAIPNFLTYRMQSPRDICIANMKVILNAEESYFVKNGKYADAIADLSKSSTGDDFIKKEPTCPCGGSYQFTPPSGSSAPVVTCTGGSYKPGFEHQLERTATDVSGQ